MAEGSPFRLEARGLGVRLGAHDALHGIDLDIEGASRIAVLGANGAGKSVLLRTLHGLLEPTSGTLRWTGRKPVEAMVFQRPVMLRRSVVANIEYAMEAAGIAGRDIGPRARRVLSAVGLPHLAARPARVLSGGEQQRVALARAWALEPGLLYLDEPTASLDPGAAAEIESVVREIHHGGTAIVFTTHNLGLARRLADEIVFLHEGRLTERTAADRFFDRPASPEALEFLRGELPWTDASRVP